MDTENSHEIDALMKQHQKANPLLTRAKIPGETFALPSRGIFYNEGELDETVKDGEVIVNPMVTMDEIILRTPDKLLNGTAIIDVFNHCIPQILKPLNLLAKDVDYLMICLRKVSYGDAYELAYKHDCKDAKEHTYLIELDKYIRQSNPIKKTSLKKDYSLTLPNGQHIQMMPPRYWRVLEFYQSYNEENASVEELSDRLFKSIVSMIISVDKVEEKEFIDEWIRQIPAGYMGKISEKIASASKWGPDLTAEFKCRDCGNDVSTEISLNPIDFFS